jgi:hypothetical protein
MLKREYPGLRLLSMNPKKYKQIFYNGLGIDVSEVVSHLDPNNTVIFTQWNSLADHDTKKRGEFLLFAQRFYRSLVSPLREIQKTIDILYLPRGIKENFKSNDRYIPAQEDLLHSIQSFFPSTFVYNTDETNNILEQIQLVRSSKIILLDYGSSLLVNSFFAEGSFIFVIGDFGHIHCKNPKPYMLLQETLKRGCSYMYVPIDYPALYLFRLMSDVIQNGFQPYTHTYNCWKINELQDCKECTSNPL